MVYQELFALDFKFVGTSEANATKVIDKPELALTIQREDGFYAARTCLTLDMAYNNARLICRPETSWIKR